MKKPHWILPEIIHAIHDEQLSKHGGSDGIRDLGLIESALARPQNLYAYGKSVMTVEGDTKTSAAPVPVSDTGDPPTVEWPTDGHRTVRRTNRSWGKRNVDGAGVVTQSTLRYSYHPCARIRFP